MSVLTPVQPRIRSAAIPPFPVCRTTVDEYHQMIAAGIYQEDDPVELLRGWVVPKMPQNPPHKLAIPMAITAINKRLPKGWYAISGQPVGTLDSEPEPDVSVIRGEPLDYFPDGLPRPPNVPLLVEGADSSLDRDQTIKKEVYAEAGFPHYWILNLVAMQVEAHSDPTGPGITPADYRQCKIYFIGDEVPLILDGVEVARIPVVELLPVVP